MHFVNDEDFVAITRRSDGHAADDYIAHIVHARVRGGVDLQHVHRTTLRDLTTRRTSLIVSRRARRRSWAFRFVTVEAFSDQSRGSRLSHAARAGKKVRVMQTIVLQSVLERAG